MQPYHRKGLALLLSFALPGAVFGQSLSIPPASAPAVRTAKTATQARPAVPAPTTSNAQAQQTSSAAGATPAPDGEIPTLPPVVVTAATRDTQPVDTTATSTTVITHDELAAQRYPDVLTALQEEVPGLAIAQSGTPGQVTSIFTRGTPSASTLLTIDGRRQAPDLTNFYDFTNLTLDNVDQVEVVRTPSSVLDGGNTIGGVINLATISGRGVTTPTGSVGFEAGSFDTFRELADSRGQEGDFDYGVAFSREDAHFPRVNNDYKNTVYRGNYGYAIAPKLYFDLQTSYTTSDAGSPGPLSFPDSTADLFRETWNISPRLTAQVTDFYTSTFYYNRTQERQVYADDPNFSHEHTQVNTDSIDWQNDFQIARNWKITGGVQGDHYVVNDFDVFAPTGIANSLTNIGGYAQSQWQPLTGLNVLSSARYDHYSDFAGAFTWRQGATYLIAPTRTTVHASVASSYTTPSIDDLYYPGFFGEYAGNPNLSPEKGFSYEFGADQPLLDDRLSVGATYFHNNITDLIANMAAFPYDRINIGSATTQGVELTLAARPCRRVQLKVNGTYNSAYDDDSHAMLPLIPRYQLNFTASWNPIDPLTLSAGGVWAVQRYYAENVPAEDYFTLRLAGSYQINKAVSVWARGENVLDESYAEVAGYPNLGAAAYAGVRVTF
jgi:vitamin B12 transporter